MHVKSLTNPYISVHFKKTFLFFLFLFILEDTTPIANGSVPNGYLVNKSSLIPNGGPSTIVDSSSETSVNSGVANGHITPVQESPFIGYIIAMHRKMVRMSMLFCYLLSNPLYHQAFV